MTRVDDYLELVDNPARQALTPGHPADDALLALLVHVAFSDGEVDGGELTFLQKVLPGRDAGQLAAWVRQVGSTALDIGAVAASLPTSEDRWKGLRFAARMAWKDGEIQREEREMLQRLADGLELGRGAVDQVLGEMQGHGGAEVSAARLQEALKTVAWKAVDVLDEPITGPLAQVARPGAKTICSIAVDDVMVVGIFTTGIAAHFLEGTAFIAWPDLVTYTRVPTFGAAVQLHTEDGRTWTLVDSRLRGIVMLLDRIFGGERRARSARPEITQVRGETEE